MEGATSGAVGATVGNAFSFSRDDPGPWLRVTGEFGIEPGIARRAVWLTIVLTNERLLLVRRSRLTKGLREVAGAWSLREIERIEVPRNGNSLTIHKPDAALRLELPHLHKFLPDVYRELPARFAEARDAQS